MKQLSKEEMKQLVGGIEQVSYDCVFSYSDGYQQHVLYVGDSGSDVQCAADADANKQGVGCTGADCVGSGACVQ